MKDQEPPSDPRHVYEDTLVRAMRHAVRHVSDDQAREIAHDVASAMVDLPSGQVTPALIYVAVTNRLRDRWRASQRRVAVEGAYHEGRASAVPAWASPGSELEVDELHRRIMDVVGRMPPAMRQVFHLIREHELSYKEAAARLGVTVGTVHAHLSRANALLRECVAAYNAGRPSAPRTGAGQP